ncbi:MAG: AIM24 family protein [Deltaproteobacteria bacterium]|nr:AIM24 family protein [Deltaproteobacteria bacterium]
MKCHEVDYEILGGDLQVVEVELDPGETVVAEAGAMNYMEDGIEYDIERAGSLKSMFFANPIDSGACVY